MAQISHKRTRQNKAISPDRISLLGHPPNTRSISTTRKRRVLGHSRRLAERSTTGEIFISPSRQQSRITLRLRQQPRQDPESAWWASSELLTGEHTRSILVAAPSLSGLMEFAKKTQTCMGCKKPLSGKEEMAGAVCENCRPRLGELYTKALTKVSDLEVRFGRL
jgi:NADH pyrophosphatase NudC (nudix superfamily)